MVLAPSTNDGRARTYSREMNESAFIEVVASIAEQAASIHEHRGTAVRGYLDGGLIPLAPAIEGVDANPLFLESLRLLIAGRRADDVFAAYDAAASRDLEQLERSHAVQRRALALLAAGTPVSAIRERLGQTEYRLQRYSSRRR